MLSADSISALQNIIATQGEMVTATDPNFSPSPSDGSEVVDGADQTSDPFGMFLGPVSRSLIDGSSIRVTDFMGYSYAPDVPVTIESGLFITTSSGEKEVIDVNTYKLAGEDVILEIILR